MYHVSGVQGSEGCDSAGTGGGAPVLECEGLADVVNLRILFPGHSCTWSSTLENTHLIRYNVFTLQRKKALSSGQMKAMGPGRGRPGARTQVSGFLGQGPSL